MNMAYPRAELTELIQELVRRVHAAAVLDVPMPLIGDRPVFLLGPNSHLGKVYGHMLASSLKNVVAVVDDVSIEETILGSPRWSGYHFAGTASAYPGAIALDLSVSRFASSMFAALCAQAGVERRDFVAALGEYGLPAVYEPVSVMRTKTIEKLDRFLGLMPRLADDLSRVTLLSALLLRLTYDRNHLRHSIVTGDDEYFSSSPAGCTFRLGSDEDFCDAGAHVGTMTAKFLSATDWQYKSIHAFEPDTINYKTLRKFCLLPLHDFRIRNLALSDRAEVLSFSETGTMGSHVSKDGGAECRTTTLDEELESLTFLKMDVEGFEARSLQGASRLIRKCRPRIAVTAYHYAHDLLNIVDTLESLHDGYELRLRQHYNYFYDTVLYACDKGGWPG
jgi:FkbM family methyltransferase